jgi:hypothetical protein
MLESVSAKQLRLNPSELTDKSCVEVAPARELPGTFLAVFGSQEAMNLALDGASRFIESKQWTDARSRLEDSLRVAGHDLTVQDLARYWAEVQRHPEPSAKDFSSADLALLGQEREFFKSVVLPLIQQEPNGVLIAIPATDGTRGALLSHEVLHAQWFEDAKYAAVARNFWDNRVRPLDKKYIRSVLAGNYDSNDDSLMANEFQAYMLQREAHRFELVEWVDRYRPALRKALQAAGVSPISLRLTPLTSGRG